MNSRFATVLVSVILLAAAGGLVWHFAHGPASAPTTQPAEEDKPMASVKTVALRIGEISQSIVAYGTVTAEPGAIAVYSVPIESRVAHVRVMAGQQVKKDDLLVEIEPSPDAKLQLLEARNGLDAAKKNLRDTQQRFDLKLATNQDLMAGQQNVQAAQLRLENLQQRGVGDASGKVVATAEGLVSTVDVQEGQIVPAGGPLVELVPQGQIQIKLGIEPSDIGRVQAEQDVRIFPQSQTSADARPGKVRFITQQIDPASRLVNVFVVPESREGLLLDSSVRAELVAEHKQALIVPPSAVLPDDEQNVMFTVKDGRAVKHIVTVGLRNNDAVQVSGENLREGDLIVVSGNLELEDGMAVATEAGEGGQ